MAGGGTVNGTAGLRNSTAIGNRIAANYDLMVTVTGNYPGTYTCTASVDKFDGEGDEPEVLNYTAPQTITVTGECVSLSNHM